jgi:hypothetical protein
MTLRENERRPSREQRALDEPFSASHPDQILSFVEWCKLNRISERTGRRILDGDSGPKVTVLSPRRLGITVRYNRVWQESRGRAREARKPAGAAT